jgi:hypothetical protein
MLQIQRKVRGRQGRVIAHSLSKAMRRGALDRSCILGRTGRTARYDRYFSPSYTLTANDLPDFSSADAFHETWCATA